VPFTAYVGNPGAGKSHGVVEHVILPALRERRCVVTNIPMQRDLIEKEFPGADLRAFDVDKYQELRRRYEGVRKDADSRAEIEREIGRELDADLPAGCVWVVDEGWKLWPASAIGDRMPEPLKEILAMHRHRTNEAGQSMVVCLVTQNLMQVSRFARDLIDETYRMRKLRSLGLGKRFMVDVYTGAVTGPNPPKSSRVRQIPGKYRAEVWRFYKSHTKAEGTGGQVDEKTVDGRGVIWRSPVWYLGVPLVLVLFGWGVWRTVKFFNPPEAEKGPPAGVSARGASRPARVGAPYGSAIDGAAWRIVGSIEGGGIDLAYLSDGRRWVQVPIAGFCDKDLQGFLVCRWAGAVVSGQVHYLPEAPRTLGPGSLLPKFGASESE